MSEPRRSCGTALFCKIARTCCGETRGLACRSNATAPATCGEAIEVPLRMAYPPSSNGKVERISPPGAPMSGLRVRSGAIPYELNDEMWPPFRLATETYPSVHVIVTGPVASRLLISMPSACEMATTGMCTAFGPVPVTLGLTRPTTLL